MRKPGPGGSGYSFTLAPSWEEEIRGMETDIDQLMQQVGSHDYRKWYDEPLPSAIDDRCSTLVRALAALSEAERASRAAPLAGFELEQSMQVFAFRMAVLAVRGGSVDRLRDGALALALNGCASREMYALISLVHHSAGKLGLRPNAFLSECAPHGTPDGMKALESFAQRPRESQRIELMGFHESARDGAFSYRFAWPKSS